MSLNNFSPNILGALRIETMAAGLQARMFSTVCPPPLSELSCHYKALLYYLANSTTKIGLVNYWTVLSYSEQCIVFNESQQHQI